MRSRVCRGQYFLVFSKLAFAIIGTAYATLFVLVAGSTIFHGRPDCPQVQGLDRNSLMQHEKEKEREVFGLINSQLHPQMLIGTSNAPEKCEAMSIVRQMLYR